LIKEAGENSNSQQACMRELVGIKVGLEYIKESRDEKILEM
jgi:hypothetical protein